MKLQFGLALVLFFVLGSTPAFAEGHAFPGIGESKKWEEASGSFNQGIAFYRAGNYVKAIEKYKQAIAIYPHDYEFFNNLGLTYKKNNQFDLASEALKKSIELKPNIWESWSNLGSVYKHQKKTPDAIEAYTKALEYSPPAKSKALLLENIKVLKTEVKTASSADEAAGAGAASDAGKVHQSTPDMTPPKPIEK